MLYKLVDGELISTITTKTMLVNGIYERVNKTNEELEGWKPLEKENEKYASQYQNVIVTHFEEPTKIIQKYELKDKPIEEIVAINQEFWNENYFMIPVSETEIYYAPHKTIMNGEMYNLLQDDLPLMLMGASAGQLTYLDVYAMPDFTQKLTTEYVATLVRRISDMAKMTIIIGYMASLTYANRIVPVVEEG